MHIFNLCSMSLGPQEGVPEAALGQNIVGVKISLVGMSSMIAKRYADEAPLLFR